MLEILVKAVDGWDERNNRFVKIGKDTTLKLEHSLISISKWESKHKKCFLSNVDALTNDEFVDYVKCMTINQVPDEIYSNLKPKNLQAITDYMNDSMTATTVRKDSNKKTKKQPVTSEIIYYWMTSYNIPFECEKWHINRLMMLITVCSEKNKPAKKRKMSKGAYRNMIAERNALNAQRRAANNTTG
jgi:hypothetical protein